MSFIQELNHHKIPLEDIKLATENFSDSNFIGHGGFGRVYRGRLPVSTSATSSSSRGTMVAVKRLDMKFGQGQHEFLMEIVMLASYKHDNVVSLVGFCDEGNEKIIVYEHEVHGSLDNHLESDLTWVQRINICLGAARGLNYLHSGVGEGHRVLHRDIKSSNVLLDENWKAKISDFGLSKIGPTNHVFTFLVTKACGTLGYLDPVYVSTGVLTKESDVYSFGVLLFEVLCGRLAVIGKYDDERRFLSHLARLRYEEGKIDDIIFPKIRKQIKHNSLQTFSEIAYQCLNMDRKRRPTMAKIVERLRISLELQLGLQQFSSPQRDYGESMDNNASGDEADNYLWSPPMSDGDDSYVKGAMNPEFVVTGDDVYKLVTADDVYKLIAVECIPMDDHGRQWNSVRVFAIEQKKIMCDPKLQQEIDKYMEAGQASFNVLLWMDSSEIWEQATFTVTKLNYQVKINQTQDIYIQGNYTVSINIPPVITTKFVLTHSKRSRDRMALTLRMFQSKALDERRKTKA